MTTEFQFSLGLGYTLAGRNLFPQWAPVFAGVTIGWSACFPGCWQAVFIGFMSGFPLLRSPSRSHGRQQLFPLRVAAPSLLQLHFRRGDCWQAVGVDPQDAWELHPLGFPAAMDERPRERPCSPDVPDQTILIGRISHGDGDG